MTRKKGTEMVKQSKPSASRHRVKKKDRKGEIEGEHQILGKGGTTHLKEFL